MILEVADIRIQAGRQAEFDAAIQRGLSTVISRAKGFKGWKVNKGVERPERYLLMIFWETLEDHTVAFRESPQDDNLPKDTTRLAGAQRIVHRLGGQIWAEGVEGAGGTIYFTYHKSKV